MSASMAEVLEAHQFSVFDADGYAVCTCGETITGSGEDWQEYPAHQASALAAAGYGKLEDAWDECEAAEYEIRLNTESNTWEAVKDNPYRRPE